MTEEELRAFQLGELPARLSAQVADHLETCKVCAAIAERLDSVVDACVLELRRAAEQMVAGDFDPAPRARGNVGVLRSSEQSTGFPRPFGQYDLLRELGRGGMSVVYLARQRRPARVVALKLILQGVHASPERRARFLAEANAIGRLQHPYVVDIYEVGEFAGQLFLALEWLNGGSLASHLTGEPQHPVATAALIEKVARGIHYAHECGIVHRDLKPSNILLQFPVVPPSINELPKDVGEVATAREAMAAQPANKSVDVQVSLSQAVPKVADFGLAKQEDVNLTATSMMLGTPAYMAPEQAAGDNRMVGPAADIHALGAVLYEMLTGRPPYQGVSVLETLDQLRSWEPSTPRQRAKVHADLSNICMKCLRKEPGQRYATGLELAEDLGRFQAGLPTMARPVSTAARVWRWVRRNPVVAGALFAVGLLLVVIAVGASVLSLSLNAALQSSEEAKRQATDKLWEAYFAQAKASRFSGRIGRRFQSLEAIRKALLLPTPPGRSLTELRTEAIAALVLPDLDDAHAWEGASSDVHVWEQHLDLARAVYADITGNVSLHRLKDDAELARLPNRGRLLWGGLSFSPDGRFVQQRTGQGQMLWDLQAPDPVAKIEIDAALHEHTVAFSSDSTRVAFVGAKDQAVVVYATESGKLLQTLHPGLRPERMEFNPRRNELAVAANRIVRVFDLTTGAKRVELVHPAPVYSLAWNPAGKILATGCHDLKIRLWNTDTGAPARQPLVGHQSEGIIVAYSRTGDFLASSDWSNLTRLWDARIGQQLLALPGNHCYFGPGDRDFVVGGFKDRLRVMPFASGRGLVRWALPFPDAGSRFGAGLIVDGPGGLFFIADSWHGMYLFDWDRGVELGHIPIVLCKAFGQDGATAFLTCGTEGLLSWPVQPNAKTRGLRIGPPTLLVKDGSDRFDYGASADGRVVAMPQFGKGTRVWHRPDRWLTLDPREDVHRATVSRDGRWVATANHNNLTTGIGATVWNARTGGLARDFFVGGLGGAQFSPDNRWLMTTGGGFRLWKVGTWEEGPALRDETDFGGWCAFSPDGKTLALTGSLGDIRLLETDTGRDIARLTVPEQTKVRPYVFSSDGTKLTAIGTESQLLYLWDLRALRVSLQELGLDWDQAAYAPAAPADGTPLRVEVDLGEFTKK
jgi:serine/threonine protein kinase/WD40 repeat protein